MNDFLEALRVQRWDDHRYYHQSRINQSLHFVSALSFLAAYAMLFIDPVVAALLGWGVAMVTRQSGHFFFEPKGYDEVNRATHEYKEQIKVGYNLKRKVVLHLVWALVPVALLVDPTLFGLYDAPASGIALLRRVGALWLGVGAGALVVRVLQLWWSQSLMTGIVWVTKILTDPFHDAMLYWRAPLYLLRGELIDPMHHARPS